MNITSILWNLFKFVYLPIGLYFGCLYESETMLTLSRFITGTVGSYLPFNVFEGSTLWTVFQVILSPAALIAWMVPEGSSLVFLAPAAILGHYGIVIALVAFSWMLAPPRFLQAKAS